MSTTAVIDRLVGERDDAVSFVEHVMEQVESEQRDVSETEQRSLDTQRERIKALDAQIKPLVEFQQTRASAVTIDKRIYAKPQSTSTSLVQTSRDDADSFGSTFVDSDQFRSFNGSPSSFGRLTIERESRALLKSDVDPGKAWMPSPTRYTSPIANLTTPLLDLIQRVPVSTGSVDILTYTPEVTGAAVVAEGADKPEVTFAASARNTPLSTIAGWVKATRQLLADAPAARTIIDNGLTRSVLKALQDEVVDAITAAPIQTVTGAAGAPLLAVIREGMSIVESNGFTPTVVIGNPQRIAELDISVMGLTLLGPALNAGYWGLRPVAVPGLGDDDIYVADAAAAIALFERTGVEVYMTDSDVSGTGATLKSDFRANIITVLAEIRAVAAVVNPAAAIKLEVTAAA